MLIKRRECCAEQCREVFVCILDIIIIQEVDSKTTVTAPS